MKFDLFIYKTNTSSLKSFRNFIGSQYFIGITKYVLFLEIISKIL